MRVMPITFQEEKKEKQGRFNALKGPFRYVKVKAYVVNRDGRKKWIKNTL